MASPSIVTLRRGLVREPVVKVQTGDGIRWSVEVGRFLRAWRSFKITARKGPSAKRGCSTSCAWHQKGFLIKKIREVYLFLDGS